MKCINCGVDNQFQDRTDNLGRCKNCGHDFAFEPKIMLSKVKITDVFFAKLIIKLSANETLFFTPTQLYYLMNKRLQVHINKND
jgi:DNA-directed RNA polymerase subunit RPC12/RpoP